MNKKIVCFRILAIILAFMVMFIGCDNGVTGSSGTEIPDENNQGGNDSGGNDQGGNDSGGNDQGGNDSDGNGINGTWYSWGNLQKYIFENGNYEYTNNGRLQNKGTYTNTNDSMAMTVTHVHGSRYISSYSWLNSEIWYTEEDFNTAYLNYQENDLREKCTASFTASYAKWTSEQIEEMVEEYRQSLLLSPYIGPSLLASAVESFRNVKNNENAARKTPEEIEEMVETQVESSMVIYRNALNYSFLFPVNNLAFSFNGNTIILGGTSLTRN